MGLVSAIVLECVDFLFLQGSQISGGSVNCTDVIFVFSEGDGSDLITLNPSEVYSLNKCLLYVT